MVARKVRFRFADPRNPPLHYGFAPLLTARAYTLRADMTGIVSIVEECLAQDRVSGQVESFGAVCGTGWARTNVRLHEGARHWGVAKR